MHHMHFELTFDKEKGMFCALTNPNECINSLKRSKIKKSSKNIQYIAIKQHDFKDYTYDGKIRDYEELRSYNLKHEGYKVIDISPYEWKKLCMAEDEAVIVDYLKKLFKEQDINL